MQVAVMGLARWDGVLSQESDKGTQGVVQGQQIRGCQVWDKGTLPGWPTVKEIELMAKIAANTSQGLIHKLSHQPTEDV